MIIEVEIEGVSLALRTTPNVFSPCGIDHGTRTMLSLISFTNWDRVLDLGCGCGVVGIYAAKLVGPEQVVMSDVDPDLVRLAAENAERNGVKGIRTYTSDGLRSIPDADFTKILTNPPYHSDFSVPKHFIEKGFNRLVIGGSMYMVTKRRQWYKKKLTAIFGGVRIYERSGYYVFWSQKRSSSYAGRK